ncbi:MAG TPA: glycerophosphodiester phosphodiesterase [Burkholderiales bacterium]|nr:glycerophosphodiester phosphodiesterase [Burkholderiales bacterium]
MRHRTWPHPRIICHRGGGTLAPENTLAGIRKAAELGFGGVEFDVMLSADRIPVLIHDETLERTTDGRGLVAATSYAKLSGLDAGGWFGPEHRGERVPTFEQAANTCVQLGLWANIEIKPAGGFEHETASVTAQLLAKLWAGVSNRPLLSSFHRTCLEVVQADAPQFERGYLTDRIEPGWREAVQQLACVSVHCNSEHLTRAQADDVKRAGYGLLCYTVNDTEVARRLLSWGVDAIFTDRLDLFPPDFA